MPSPRIRTVVINAEDPALLVAFWSGFFDVEVREDDPESGIVWLQPSSPGGVSIAIQRVAEHSVPTTHVHLDVAVDDLDLATATIERLGGRVNKVNRLDNGFEWRVVQDPVGHEFCIFVD